MPRYIAYVEWSPQHVSTHEAVVEQTHSVKSCAAKNQDLDVEFDCDVQLPDVIRHMVTGETQAQSLSAARRFALGNMAKGTDYHIHYVGVIEE